MQFYSFLRNKRSAGLLRADHSENEHQKHSNRFSFQRRQASKTVEHEDAPDSASDTSSSSCYSSESTPPSSLTVKSCLRNDRQEKKRRQTARKQVHWKCFHEAISLPEEDYYQGENLWWTIQDLKEFKTRGSKIVANEVAAYAYIVDCKEAYTAVLPMIAAKLPKEALSAAAAGAVPCVEPVDAPEAGHWLNKILLTSRIIKGLTKHGYRGLERMTASRKLKSRATVRKIVAHGRSNRSAASLADFARRASKEDCLWAHAMALEDACIALAGATAEI